MSIFKVSPENRNLDYYLQIYNSKFVANDSSLEVIQLYYYLYENVDVKTDELDVLERYKPDLDGFCKRGGRSNNPLFNAINRKYVRNTTSDDKEIPEKFYNPITLLENNPRIYIAEDFGKDIMTMRSIIWNDTYTKGVGNLINFDMLMLAYKMGDIKHLLSPIKGITNL